jgi:CRP-like cAMP-binding protein
MTSTDARVSFLRRMHLFHDVKDEELVSIAQELQEQTFDEDAVIFAQGSQAENFYIIYQGKVKITQRLHSGEVELASLVSGDYFGEEALFANRKRSATIRAAAKTYLFSLTRAQFNAIIKRIPKLKTAFEVSIASRRLARQMHFTWTYPDEVIYFIARKHEVLLARALTAPILSLVVPIALIVGFFATRSLVMISLAALLIVVILLWAVWNAIDWGNDYYIVTNKRVIWLEKVIGIYDSRQEAPLSTVLSVGVETDMSGRLLDYGNVIVRTFTGKIPFHHVSHPYEAAHLVEEQWTRTKHTASREEKEAMRNVLRQKLGLPVVASPEVAPDGGKIAVAAPSRRTFWTAMTANWFKLRMEDSGTITYRKHWYVLWQQTWEPSILILLLIVGIAVRLATIAGTAGAKLIDFTNGFKVDTIVVALPILMIPFIIWWVYQYVDWSNDIFQVTPDQILDVDRKPFGTSERRAAPLENILSTEAKRIGLAGYIFNFGIVEITVGGTKLEFRDVLDPAAVQADIDRRRAARIAQKREVEVSAERERMADWLVAYHADVNELREQQSPPDPEQNSESPVKKE